MFKKETTALCHHTAFCPAHSMRRFDENDVLHDVLIGDLFYLLFMVILKQQTHFHRVVAYCTTAVTTYN